MSTVFLRELEQLFSWLLAASWQASVLALLVLGLHWMLRTQLNPRWRYALWLLVLARLVLPALPESALSLFQFAPPPPASLVVPVTEPLFGQAIVLPPQADKPFSEPNHPFSTYSLLAIVWLLGAVGLLILTWQVNRRFARQVSLSPEIADPELLESFAAARKELSIRRAIRLIESGQVQSPAIMGLFQPTLLLPTNVRDKFDARELRFIFLHELAHLKRGDVIVQGLIALLQILHWFNPVLWFAFRRMRIDREPATDALVLSRTGEEEKERYGLMLIKLLEHFNQRHSLPTLVGILEEKDQFRRRFSLIARFTRGAYGWSLLGVLLIGVLAVLCLTKSKATKTSDTKNTETNSKPKTEALSLTTTDINKPMLEAAQKNDVAAVQKLIDQGINPSKIQDKGTPLIFRVKSPEMAELLLQHGADANARDKTDAILSYVCRGNTGKNGAAIAEVLLKHRADPNTRTGGDLKVTSLMEARDGDTVDVLLKFGADPKAVDSEGADVVCHAFWNDPSALEALLRHGASFDPKTDGAHLMVKAAEQNNLELVRWLLAHGVDPNTEGLWYTDKNGPRFVRPLIFATRDGQEKVVTALLDHGAKFDGTIVAFALRSGDPKLVKLYHDRGAKDLSELGYEISQNAPPDDLRKLLEKGGPVDPPEDKLITPLGEAALAGKMDVVQLLIQHGADVNKGESAPGFPNYPHKPLLLAAGKGHDEIVRYLLEHGATPLPGALQAAFQDWEPTKSNDQIEKIGRLLIDAGVLRQATPEEQGSILAATIQPSDAVALKMLLNAGVSPRSPMKDAPGGSTTVIAYYRDFYQKYKNDPSYGKTAAKIKPLLDILEAADKGMSTPTASPIPANDAAVQTSKLPPYPSPVPGSKPLRDAIDADQVDAVKSLLDHGAVIDPEDMFEALIFGQKPIGKLLWDHGPHYCSELAYAISQDEPISQIEQLLGKGMPADPPEDSAVSPLGIATQRGNLAVAQLLIKHGANLNPGSGQDPLRIAAEEQNSEMVGFLLKNGAHASFSSLNFAIVNPEKKPSQSAPQIVELLIQAGGSKGISEDQSALLLIAAADQKNPDLLKPLLDAGLSPRSRRTGVTAPVAPDDAGKTALEIVRAQYALPNGQPWKKELSPMLNLLEAADAAIRAKAIAQLTAKLQAIRIDHLAFKDTPLNEVISAVDSKSMLADPDKKGFNFVLRTTSTPPTDAASQPSPTITLDLSNVSLADALKSITQAARLQYSVEEYAVYLRPAVDGEEPMTVRTFGIPAKFFQATTGATVDAKQELISKGIAFPADASATYLPEKGKLVVRDTPEQLDKIAGLLDALEPSQVQLELKVVEIPDDVYQAHRAAIDTGVEKGDAASSTALFHLFNNLKGVSLLSAPSVTTSPGLKANIDIVRELSYPTSFDNPRTAQIPAGPNGATTMTLSIPPTPREFATRDIGITSEMTPSCDQGKIIVNGKFTMTEFEGFTKSNVVDKGTPSFNKSESYFFEALDDKQEKGIWIPGEHVAEEKSSPSDKQDTPAKFVKKRYLLFLSARMVRPGPGH